MSFALTAPIIDATASVCGERKFVPRPSPNEGRKALPLAHDFNYPATAFTVELWSECVAPSCGDHLVDEAYAKLGYLHRAVNAANRTDSVTLHATQATRTTGTLTVNFDCPGGLNADTLYADELLELRSRGPVCEFTRLALDRTQAGKEVLCGLFYVAYVYSHLIKGFRHLAIEVNPRHEAFYARMLGFKRTGPERLCPRVSAPAVLLTLDFAHTREQIEKFRNVDGFSGAALYRYAAPRKNEETLIRKMRLREGQSAATR